MSDLLPANRAKDPLEVLQNRLFDRKAPANAALLPERKIPSLALDLGAIIDDMLMTDTIGGDPESTGQALPGMAMPFGKATKLKGAMQKTIEPLFKKISDIQDNVFKIFGSSNHALGNEILKKIDSLKARITNESTSLKRKSDKELFDLFSPDKPGDPTLRNDIGAIQSAQGIDAESTYTIGEIKKLVEDHKPNTVPSRVLRSIVDKFTDDDPSRPYGLIRANLVNSIKRQHWDYLKARYKLNDIEIQSLKRIGQKENFELTPMRKLIDNDLRGDNTNITDEQKKAINGILTELNYFKTLSKDVKSIIDIKESGEIFEIPKKTNVIDLKDAINRRTKKDE